LSAKEVRTAVYRKIHNGRLGKVHVRVCPSESDINIGLHCEKMPSHCDLFFELAKKRMYDGPDW
jgi:hypothetical protein